MFDWVAKLRRQAPVPLTVAPAVRRQKTYSGQSGYVYQYFYEGYRPARRGSEQGTEYVFDVSADRKSSFPVSVFLVQAAVEAWEKSHQRALVANERYALAKMALFQAFDERADPEQMRVAVEVRPADVEGILSTLDID